MAKPNFISFTLIIFSILVITATKQEFTALLENEGFEEIIINGENETEQIIKSNLSYVFVIKNENYLYSFSAKEENIFFIRKENDTFEIRPNETFFENGEKIYVNHLKNLNETKIKISPSYIHSEFNSFETINENQYFFIKSENKSIAYFDSFDKNSKVFISKSRQKTILEEDIRINGKFKEIEPNIIYLIKNEIFNISVFKKYFYPLYLNTSEIDINGNNKNFFYLVQNETYIFNFKNNSYNIMIKLSEKTLNAKVSIINEKSEIKEINKDSPYYILDKNFKEQLKFKVEENNAFIEFLFNYGNYEILTVENKGEIKANKSIEILKLPYTQKSFEIKIKSEKKFKYSLSFGLSNNEQYFYSSNSNSKIISKNNEEILTYLALFKNINLSKDEFLLITINLEKEENQNIFISYKQYSEIDELIDEKMEPETLKQIIKLSQKLFESYIYVDIAQNPPDVGIPNYHHRKINLIEELGNIKTENRKFYEFYQEIQTILSVVRDGHLSISSYTTPKGIQFFEYWAVNAFRYIIKEYKGEQRIFITIREDYINKYDNNTQTFLRNHLEIPIKSINDMDPFDYIQSWSQFICVKNQIHSKFVHNLYYIPGFYLLVNPLNYTEFIENEFEFEDNKIIRVSYIIGKPEIKSEKFKQFFINMVKKYRNERFLPPIDELKNIFLHKNILNQELKNEEKKINWDVEYSENKEYIKCRVDNENQVNVLAQNTFYLDFQISAGKIMYCAKLFHSNNYPIILIEDRNIGGYPNLAYLMIQLFQMREVERTYSAMKYNEINKKYLNIEKSYGEYIYNPDTCEMINSFDNLMK